MKPPEAEDISILNRIVSIIYIYISKGIPHLKWFPLSAGFFSCFVFFVNVLLSLISVQSIKSSIPAYTGSGVRHKQMCITVDSAGQESNLV